MIEKIFKLNYHFFHFDKLSIRYSIRKLTFVQHLNKTWWLNKMHLLQFYHKFGGLLVKELVFILKV